MNKIVRKSFFGAVTVSTAVFSFVPEDIFANWNKLKEIAGGIVKAWISCPLNSEQTAATIGRVLFLVTSFLFLLLVNNIRLSRSVTIKNRGNTIRVEYGDLLKWKRKEKGKCWKVIPFDECFTSTVNKVPGDNTLDSVCGQYLNKYPIENMQTLIDTSELTPLSENSRYRNQIRYEAGSIIQRDENYFLMAFAKLDKDGRGMFETQIEYLKSLDKLWDELDKHYRQKDVCIPVLGSGITRIEGKNLPQQELVDIIICSYKLSSHKIKNRIRIICRKDKNFSMVKIGENI